MADAQRTAEAVWEGSLAQGGGTVTLTSSGAAGPLPVTWASRTARSEGKTSPEELVAAAHASCYCMALSGILGEAGTPPQKLEASAIVTFAQVEGGFKVASSALTVKGTVPGLDAAGFKEAAEAAKEGCPISGALKGNVALSVTATLA
ncbi:MAG: OsmC family peroxiredoxin [Actinobacteria bacterium]|nr:OsmC family peroxiredoxin [Actinomycetota bacterium]